jgi:hypothetical protein
MATTLTASTEVELNTDIAEANAAASGSFVIDLLGDITETADLTAIDLQSGVTLIIDGNDGSGGSFTLDGAGSNNGISVDAGGAGSGVTIENLEISNVPTAQPATLSSGTLSGTVTISSNATFDQTADVTFGDTNGPATVTNQGTYEIDQLTAGTYGPAINGVAGSLFINDGTMVKLADKSGISEIYVDVTDTGTLSVSDSNSNLRFDGASNSFSGIYIGGGMIDYGDPATFQTVGNGSYSVNTLGNLDMSDGACTTTWADVNQNGQVTTSSNTSISNNGTWNFTSDNGLTLENPSEASTSIAVFALFGGTLAKTGGTGTTVIGIDFNEYGGPVSHQNGLINIASGTLAFNGLLNNFYSVISGNGTFSLGGGGADALYDGTAITTGGWTITGAGTDVTPGVPLSYSGTFTEQSGATLTLTSSNDLTLSNATFDGTVTGGSDAAIVLASGGTLQIDDLASVVNGSQIQNFNAPIGGFASGDILRLEGFGEFATINGTSPSYNSSTNTTSLTLTDNGSAVATLELTGGNYTSATVNPDPLISGAVDIATACYCRGTLILTERGEVAVEDLAIGDEVVTLSGAARPIRWIGHRHINLARHPNPRLAQPIRIRSGAFADGVPRRDLLISPDHAIYVGSILIPARLLRNGATIVREERFGAVQYFHVELDEHDLLLAEGLAAESYLDTGNRGMFENATAPLVLHPDLMADDGQVRREAFSCAPFVADAVRVEPLWRQFAIRAWQLGYVLPEADTTEDPALCVRVKGRVLAPVEVANGRFVFVLPPNAGEVRLLSRTAPPCEARPWVEDRRRLGVAVRRLTLRRGSDEIPVPLDHPVLTAGWWGAERDGAALWRWTDGDARLPVEGPATLLVVELGGMMTYSIHAVEPKLAAA